MDVIFKEGMLYLQGSKFGKKTWRKIWMVLFKPSSSGVGRLEFCAMGDSSSITEQKKAGRQKTSERKVLRLIDCLSVTPARKESCPAGCTAFYLNTTQCTYVLASTSSQEWLNALCLLAFQKDPGGPDKGDFEEGNSLAMEDNALYSSWKSELILPPNQYQVTIHDTDASKRCNLDGEYRVSVEKDAVMLLGLRTGSIIYHWPYKLLRKFGQVEGGFSIEAGRRCESGPGVFIFLTQYGSQIFQAISKHCTVEKKSALQPNSTYRNSLPDMSILHQVVDPSIYNFADVSADTEDKFANHYPIYDTPVQKGKEPSLVKPHLSDSQEAIGEEADDEDEKEWCHSLEALKLDSVVEDRIYCNVRRATPPLMRKAEVDDSEYIYSDVRKGDSVSNLQLQPSFSLLSPPVPPVPPVPPLSPVHVPYTLPRPQNQHQLPVNNYIQPGYNTQAHLDEDEDDMYENEEASGSSALAAPREEPGSFKQRLAEIISKDLAKFQPPLPYGAGNLTFSE